MNFLIKHFHGRINRRSYFFGGLLWYLCVLGFYPIIYFSSTFNLNPYLSLVLVYVWVAFLLVLNFSLLIRRLHDFGWSGWLSLPCFILYFVPLVDLVTALVLLFKAGDEKENKYGKPPKPETSLNTLFN